VCVCWGGGQAHTTHTRCAAQHASEQAPPRTPHHTTPHHTTPHHGARHTTHTRLDGVAVPVPEHEKVVAQPLHRVDGLGRGHGQQLHDLCVCVCVVRVCVWVGVLVGGWVCGCACTGHSMRLWWCSVAGVRHGQQLNHKTESVCGHVCVCVCVWMCAGATRKLCVCVCALAHDHVAV
jgi:hypothetical protein